MKRFFPFFMITFLLVSIFMTLGRYSETAYAQNNPTPTPTYDPLAEPFLPENPSEYELGRNWYWHNCMTCHGDVGQGLTDEFRSIWPEDHQNCWEHGCHGGHMGDEGFPVPTVVPALVREGKLAQFSCLQAFEDFLKTTHPPQDPGCLEDEQYHVIAMYVFSMNNRPLDETTPVPAAIPTLSKNLNIEAASGRETASQPQMMLIVGLGILTILLVIWGLKKRILKFC